MKLTITQRDQIISMLGEGIDRNAIALSLGVTIRQVAAIAAHVTMQTYGRKKIKRTPAGIHRSMPTAKSVAEGESRKSVGVLIGTTIDQEDSRYWTPTPESGTPNPHLLILGESGSGKTYATQCICAELAQNEVPIIVFDFGQGFTLEAAPDEFIQYARPHEISAGRDGININPLHIFPSDLHGP